MTTDPTSDGAMPLLPPGRAVELPDRGTTWICEGGDRNAPTLLLIHGWMATAPLNWFTTFDSLSERYHVVAMDIRGHGKGIRSRRPFRLTDCADDAAALCEVLGITAVTAVGYSMGGPICQLLWDRHPELVEGLVMCATAGKFPNARWGPKWGDTYPVVTALRLVGEGAALGLSYIPPGTMRALAKRVIRDRLRNTPLSEWSTDQRSYNDAAALIRAGIELGRYDGTELLPRIDVPTAVVQTVRDQIVPIRRQERMTEAIPGATAYPIDTDHGACVEEPRPFARALLAACEDVTTRAKSAASPPAAGG